MLRAQTAAAALAPLCGPHPVRLFGKESQTEMPAGARPTAARSSAGTTPGSGRRRGELGCAPSSREGLRAPLPPHAAGPRDKQVGRIVTPGRPSGRWLCQEASLLGGALAATSRPGDLARNRAPADPLPLSPRSRVSKMGRRGRAARSPRGAHTYHPHRRGPAGLPRSPAAQPGPHGSGSK